MIISKKIRIGEVISENSSNLHCYFRHLVWEFGNQFEASLISLTILKSAPRQSYPFLNTCKSMRRSRFTMGVTSPFVSQPHTFVLYCNSKTVQTVAEPQLCLLNRSMF